MRIDPEQKWRRCPCCGGCGCEECDQTGKRYRETLDAGNGVVVSVTGSGEGLTDEQREAFTKLMAVAYEHVSAGGTEDG